MKRVLFLVRAMLGVAAMAASAWAQISGRVVDHNGAPVPQARVRVVPLANLPAAGAPPAAANSASRSPAAALSAGPDGAFASGNLPAGLYRLCASAAGKELLDPCLWESRPTAPVAVNGNPRTGLSVQLLRETTLSIRVDDATKAIAAAERSGQGHLLVGVWAANGGFHPARPATDDATGRTYSIALPAGRPARLTVNATGLRLRDASGKPLAPAGSSLNVEIPVAQAAAGQTVRFAVLN
ncbi:MAG: carboxypeptidase regulatory-like domain-containing protein [Bryobacterales bacterium]|nr:carboxypeptidase regulatory-like domain-containing protein [Bryobacterales bacterium]